jgi:hypothetical protein
LSNSARARRADRFNSAGECVSSWGLRLARISETSLAVQTDFTWDMRTAIVIDSEKRLKKRKL